MVSVNIKTPYQYIHQKTRLTPKDTKADFQKENMGKALSHVRRNGTIQFTMTYKTETEQECIFPYPRNVANKWKVVV